MRGSVPERHKAAEPVMEAKALSARKKSAERKGSSKKSSGQFNVESFLNEYDLPNLQQMARRKDLRKGTGLRKRGSSKESRSTNRDRTTSRTRHPLEETRSDMSSELRTPNLEFFKQMTKKKEALGEVKKTKNMKKVVKRKSSKSKEANKTKNISKLFKKPKKSVPVITNANPVTEIKAPQPVKKKPVQKHKVGEQIVSSPSRAKNASVTRSRQSSVPRTTSKSRDHSVRSRKSSKKKPAEKKKEEYFVGVSKPTLKKKPNSIAIAKGSLHSIRKCKENPESLEGSP